MIDDSIDTYLLEFCFKIYTKSAVYVNIPFIVKLRGLRPALRSRAGSPDRLRSLHPLIYALMRIDD